MAVLSNLSIDQGSDFSAEIVVEDSSGDVANLTGYTGAGQIRKTYTSSTKVDFGVVVTNATAGLLTLTLANTVTNAMKAGRYVYDVEVRVGVSGDITRVVEGQVEITPGVTR